MARTAQVISGQTITEVMREISQLGRALKELVRPELTGGLHLGALMMLSQVAQLGEPRCSEVAERSGLDVSVVSRQLSVLAGLDLISRHPDPADGRAWRSRITPAGERLLTDVRAQGSAHLAGVLSAWDETELVALRGQLARLNHDLLTTAGPRKAR